LRRHVFGPHQQHDRHARQYQHKKYDRPQPPRGWFFGHGNLGWEQGEIDGHDQLSDNFCAEIVF